MTDVSRAEIDRLVTAVDRIEALATRLDTLVDERDRQRAASCPHLPVIVRASNNMVRLAEVEKLAKSAKEEASGAKQQHEIRLGRIAIVVAMVTGAMQYGIPAILGVLGGP